jgi:hypothetical protein
MMNNAVSFLIMWVVICSSLAYAQSDTEKEVMQTILEGEAYVKANMKSPPDHISEHGDLAFWSSGGLLQEIAPGKQTEYDSYSVQVKHIKVITLVKDKAAVAMYYAEGSLKPKGGPLVSHYLTRVTIVFVKEEGKWKARSSHWSPITGGSGTSQTAPPPAQ